MKRLATIAAALGVAAVLAGAGVWYFVIRSDAPPPVSLQSALNQASSTPAASTSTGATTTSDAAPDDLTGEWSLVGGGSSFAGYRVQEELVGIGSTTAVGRTTSITGSLTFDGNRITDVKVVADLTKLASDKSMRDTALRTQAIQTNTYPTATFALTSPIDVSEVPEEGDTVIQMVTGDLTLHGVTKTISVEVQAVLKDGRLVVVGSTVIQFDDYAIEQPRSSSVLSIEDKGTMELQLIFEKAA